MLTPSLTGLGERAHLTGPQVGLSTHVLDVINAVRYEDVSDLVLLGFSYGGMVVSGALERIGERVREIVFVDAFVPGDGDSVASLIGGALGGVNDGIGEPWSMPAVAREYDDHDTGDWSNVRRVAQPLRTFVEPVRLARPLEQWPFGRTYIRATQDPNGAMFDTSARLQPSGHSLSPPLAGAGVSGHAFPRSVRKPQTRLASPPCRTPPGQQPGPRQTHPGTEDPPRF